MVLIYTDKITNRIKYIFNLLLKEILNVDFELTKNADKFKVYEGVKFSYCKKPLDDELYFHAENLLVDRGISHTELTFIDYEGIPAFFPVYTQRPALPFDPFAASFYLVSRYEEYLPYRKDEYGRFSTSESIAFQKDFLHKPMVNIWAYKIGEILKQRFNSFNFTGRKYKFLPTIDIDAAWAYKQKGVFRTMGGYLNELSRLDFKEIAFRTKVLLGTEKDPFDTYEFQLQVQKKYNIQHIYFILFAEYGFNDKNTPIQSMAFRKLIKSLADYAEVGIHPSYNSNLYTKKLKQEINKLSKVLNREITKSRQHFLKLQFPTTYRNLINLDITDDYSMGFAAKPGFRAGICSSFNFYDLDLDTETNLRVHPFTFMEGTLRDYMEVEADEAMDIIKPLIDEVKAVNGTFISLWHNESLSNDKRWVGWHTVYEEMIREALP